LDRINTVDPDPKLKVGIVGANSSRRWRFDDRSGGRCGGCCSRRRRRRSGTTTSWDQYGACLGGNVVVDGVLGSVSEGRRAIAAQASVHDIVAVAHVACNVIKVCPE
jgi:hypothetical protein